MQIPHFASREEYGKRFTDVKYWRPYVEILQIGWLCLCYTTRCAILVMC
ncbi:MAG TPA: hypothetical protein VK140_00420 [Ktedonobacteraceae bacterium]|nr:hypothetical protein [Ktedonobacteraceae bacterium]